MNHEAVQYTTIEKIQELTTSNFNQYHVTTSFVDALIWLRDAGKLESEKYEVPYYIDPLPDDLFLKEILKLPINVTQIIMRTANSSIVEDEIIPLNKDVFAFKHLPFNDDQLHNHDYFEITYLYSGSCKLIFDNEVRTLNVGDFSIISPYSLHNILVDTSCLALSLLVRKSTFDKLFWNLLAQKDLLAIFFRNALYEAKQANFLLFRTENLLDIKQLMQSIMWECYREDSYANSYAVSLVNQLFIKILRYYSDTAQLYHASNVTERSLDFALMLQFIQQNYRTVTLASLAKTFHYSKAHLCRLFIKNLNQTFTTTIRDLRMHHAVDFLTNMNINISEISERIGYNSVDHFSRTFKKLYKCSPLEYRKKHM